MIRSSLLPLNGADSARITGDGQRGSALPEFPRQIFIDVITGRAGHRSARASEQKANRQTQQSGDNHRRPGLFLDLTASVTASVNGLTIDLLADLGRLGSQLADRLLDSGFNARIGDARSTYEDGILTRVNQRAAVLDIAPGMTAREFVEIVRRAAAVTGRTT